MVEELGLNLLVPIFVFGFLIVTGIIVTNIGLEDVSKRKSRGEI